jgi:hypothetical protein
MVVFSDFPILPEFHSIDIQFIKTEAIDRYGFEE